MNLSFFKYQGTGNDFIVIDNRQNFFDKNNNRLIADLCDRRFGIGADGLLLLQNDSQFDFKMVYFNADGHEGTMCGNGGRCMVAFANFLGLVDKQTTFSAVDGPHFATFENGIVSLQMANVHEIKSKQNTWFLNTGSPHHVQIVEGLDALNVKKQGAKLRYGLYGKKGSNINFVAPLAPSGFAVRTYERGVEDETLSCGTGVTAVAIAMHAAGRVEGREVHVETKGGGLQVKFEPSAAGYTNVFLIGPAVQVFKGEMVC